MSMRYPGGLIATSPVNARYPSGVWTQAQAIPYQSQNVWTRDQFWPYTTLLLQGDGAANGAQNNTFLDSSSNNFTITRNGNTTQGSFTPYEQDGYWSNYFDGNGDYLSLASNAAFAMGTGDFTVEAFVFLTTNQNFGVIFLSSTTGSGDSLHVQISSANKVRVTNATTEFLVGTNVIQLNTWTHIAVVRSGTTLSIYQDGVLNGSTTNSTNFIQSGALVGYEPFGGNFYFTGYISNLRVLKGTALYTASFAPPSAPLTAITNTSLLTCQSNRFIDNSTNAFAITRNGDVSVQAFQPFPGATTWSASVLGGSGYFDGSGDYLQTPSNAAFAFGTGDFTIEAWAYPQGGQYYNVIAATNSSGAYQSGRWWFEYSQTRGFAFITGNATYSQACTVDLNTWAHIAVTRSGTSLRFFLNGVQQGSAQTVSDDLNTTAACAIAALASGGLQPFTGYISSLRVLKGTALYTSNFTPPTAPLTAITNTSLLCNFTNAGIWDNSMMNNLETVGNAQVSTSVVKYGTGSMAFDGSGDYLKARFGDQSFALGSGDWTFEAWVYLNNTSGNQAVFIGQSDYVNAANASYLMYVTGSYAGYFYYGSSYVTLGAPGLSAGVWTHVAWVRNGGTITFYRNGTSIATVSISTNSINVGTTNPFCIGDATSGVVPFNGYLDDVRITKAARYITNFTPPPARLPAQ